MNCIQENSDNKKKTPRDIIKRDRVKGDRDNKNITKIDHIKGKIDRVSLERQQKRDRLKIVNKQREKDKIYGERKRQEKRLKAAFEQNT